MMIEVPNLRDTLRRYIAEVGWTHKQFADALVANGDIEHLAGTSISNFLSGRNIPHRKNVEAITHFLQEKGKISNLGMPKDLVNGTFDEKKTLQSMGIVASGNRELDQLQYEEEKVSVITALTNASSILSPLSRNRILGRLYPSDFPEFSKNR